MTGTAAPGGRPVRRADWPELPRVGERVQDAGLRIDAIVTDIRLLGHPEPEIVLRPPNATWPEWTTTPGRVRRVGDNGPGPVPDVP